MIKTEQLMHGEVTNPAINLTPMPLHVIAIIIHVQATEEYRLQKKKKLVDLANTYA
jgi:hypothetical protein